MATGLCSYLTGARAWGCVRRFASLTGQLWQQQQLPPPPSPPQLHTGRFTGFNLFVKTNFARLRGENPGQKAPAIITQLGHMYKQLDDGEKNRLKQEASVAQQLPSAESQAEARQQRTKMHAFAKRHGMPSLPRHSWYTVLVAERTRGRKGQKPQLGVVGGAEVSEEERQRLRAKAAQMNADSEEQLKQWAASHGLSARLRPSTMMRKFYAKYGGL